MRRFVILLLFGSAVAASAWIWRDRVAEVRLPIGRTDMTPPRDTQVEAEIALGRLEVMQDQVGSGLRLLGAQVEDLEPAHGEKPLQQRVYRTVNRYNALKASACAGRIVGGALCSRSPYRPRWYDEFHFYAGAKDPYEDGLSWTQEVQSTMTPLWEAVCARAEAKSGDQNFCAIE